MKTAKLISAILATVFTYGVFAQQAGDLDSTFGGDGIVAQLNDQINKHARSAAIQSDGKIVVTGYSYNGSNWDFALSRYNMDGSLDNSFSSDGKLAIDFGSLGDEPYSVAIQLDGKIVVAGYSWDSNDEDFALARINVDGTLDNNFGIDGLVTTDFDLDDDEAYSVSIQSDGKIVVAGNSWNGTDNDIALLRYNTNGSLDTSFSTDGKLTTDLGLSERASSIVIQTDGKIVVAGYSGNFPNGDFSLVRYNTDGTLDTTFSTDGKLTTAIGTGDNEANSVAIQPDGKIIAAGYLYNGNVGVFALARYTSDGTLDSSFNTDGKLTTYIGADWDEAFSVLIQSDGKIVAAGEADNGTVSVFALARYISGLNVGVLDFSLAENVLLYPNPIHSNEVLEYSLQQDEVLTIGLYDISGRLVKQLLAHESRSKGAHKESLHFGEALAPGNYILRITNESGSMGVKVVKQ